MPDPVSAAAVASAPTAISAGLSAAALAAVGVDVQALSLGLAGAVLGLTFAPPAHPVHGAARFVASAIVSAVIGTAAGQQITLSRVATNAVICGAGAVMHLALSWIGKRFGQLADAGMARVGVDVGDK